MDHPQCPYFALDASLAHHLGGDGYGSGRWASSNASGGARRDSVRVPWGVLARGWKLLQFGYCGMSRRVVYCQYIPHGAFVVDSDTRLQIRKLIANDKTLNLSAIAKRIGISRERVRQIVNQEGLAVQRGVVGYRPRRNARPPAPRVLTGGVGARLDCTVVGTISELLVAADLAARGYKVFFPLVRTAACDMVIMDSDGENVQRIEVRSGHRRVDRKGIAYATNPKSDKARCDRYAIVITGEPVFYRPKFNDSEG